MMNTVITFFMIYQLDVRAAREKNGVYIPHERFLQDEAEKKVCVL